MRPSTRSAAMFLKNSNHQLIIASPQRWDLRGPFPNHTRILFDLVLQALWEGLQVLWINVRTIMPRTLHFTVLLLIQQLVQFFYPFFQDVPGVLDVEIYNNIYDSPIAEHSPLYLAFWSDILFYINLSLLWWGNVSLTEVRATQTCLHKHKYLEHM